MTIALAPGLKLPDDAVTQTFGILAKRGAGKSNAAAVMAEEMHRAGLPFVVVDPVGAWWGLRSDADGKRAGIPVPIGAKRIETRSWQTSYRGPLAIHAAALPADPSLPLPLWIPFSERYGGLYGDWVREGRLPLGAVVATCRLVECLQVSDIGVPINYLAVWNESDGEHRGEWRQADEQAFGDYSPGRYAWLLGNIRRLNPPIAARGRQRLWEWGGGAKADRSA